MSWGDEENFLGMRNESVRAETSIWVVTGTLIALASVYAFLQDMIDPSWPAWVLAPLIVVGFRKAVALAPQDSMVRPALYQAALVLVPFMGIYGLLDIAFKPDWPAWVIAPIVVLLLWMCMATVSEVEAD